MDNHDYCRLMLKTSRIGLHRKYKISSSKISDDHYAVFIIDNSRQDDACDSYSEHGACCAFYARAEAIAEYMGDKPSDYHNPR